MEDKVKELELQLDNSFRDLKHSESEKILLKSQVDMANERFEKMRKHCQEIELNQKALKDQLLESEKKSRLQLESFEEALRDKELMNMELLDAQHTSNKLGVELESSTKMVKELQEQIKEKEIFEAGFRNQEMQMVSLQQDLSSLAIEKRTLQTTMIDLQTRLSLSEEMCGQFKSVCGQLETRLSMAEENFNRADSILSETLAHKEELEQKLELLQMENDDSTMAKVIAKRNIELEGLVKKLIASEAGAKEQLTELEAKLAVAEEKNKELDQKLSFSEVKLHDAQKEIDDLNDQVKELNNMLEEVEEEATELLRTSHGYEDKIGHLETTLSKSFRRNTELERSLSELVEQVEEREGQVTETQQRSVELEGLVRSSTSKAGDAVKRMNELELLLEASNYRTYELEQLLSIEEAKVQDAAAESRQQNHKIAELLTELEAYKTKSESLETVVQDAKDKETDLTEMLNVANNEWKKLQEFSATQTKSLSESENLIQILQNDLKSLRANLESVEKELEASRVREKEQVQKLRKAEEKLKNDGKTVEEVTAKNRALMSQHENVVKDSEKKLTRAFASFKQKSSEADGLYSQLKYLGEQVAFYKEQVVEDAEKIAAFKEQLDASTLRMVSLESSNAELKDKLLEANTNSDRLNSENEVLAGTNTKLREELRSHQIKVQELSGLLNNVDKGELTEPKVTEQSRSLDLSSATESRLKETEIQLQETVEKLEQRDSEAAELNEKLLALEAELRIAEEKLKTSALEAEETKGKLEDALVKITDQKRLVEDLQRHSEQLKGKNEYLVRENQSLSQMLETTKAGIAELQASFNAVVAEKEVLSLQMYSSRKEMDDLVKQLDFNKEIIQSQIEILREAVAEKDTLLAAKREEQTTVVHERDILHQQLKEMQNELALAHLTVIEQKDLESKKELERQESIKQSLGELESKRRHATILEKQVGELKQRLLVTEQQYQEKIMQSEKFATLTDELNEMKHNLRQTVEMEKTMASLHNQFQLQLHKVSKEDNKEMPTFRATSIVYVEPGAHFAVEPSGAMAFKFLMGVAFLSVIFGVVLGKRY